MAATLEFGLRLLAMMLLPAAMGFGVGRIKRTPWRWLAAVVLFILPALLLSALAVSHDAGDGRLVAWVGTTMLVSPVTLIWASLAGAGLLIGWLSRRSI